MSEEGKFLSWQEALAEDPDYYLNTEAGQRELAQMIREESERLLEELGRSVKMTREVIWLSRHCADCRFFERVERRMTCRRWGVRIVKPFYGRTIWKGVQSKLEREEKEFVIEDIDWNTKWKEISDIVIERAIDLVNGGYPYFCFTSK